MNTILCSTGALIGKPNGRNYKLLEPCARELSCDGFEFMMYESWYGTAGVLIEDLLCMQLFIPVMHCDKHIGELLSSGEKAELQTALELFSENCRIASELGASTLVLHLWNGLPSDRHIENHLAAFPFFAEIASSFRLDLTVENVICNCGDPMTHWRELAQMYPDIHFTFDTKMAAFHGQTDIFSDDSADWMFPHIRHLHVNDYAGGIKDWKNLKTLAPGEGHVDFGSFFDWLCRRHAYSGTMTVEATAFDKDGNLHIDRLNAGFEKIRGLLSR